jgi:hypothetical protein
LRLAQERRRSNGQSAQLVGGMTNARCRGRGVPLVDPKALGGGTDREKLASLDVAGAQQYLLKVIDERRADANKARAEFTEDLERIFSIPDLFLATLHSQDIGANTVYAWIVRDGVQRAHLFSAILLGIIAFVLAALVSGGGWVAAATLIGSAAISTAQAYEAGGRIDAHPPIGVRAPGAAGNARPSRRLSGYPERERRHRGDRARQPGRRGNGRAGPKLGSS